MKENIERRVEDLEVRFVRTWRVGWKNLRYVTRDYVRTWRVG